jgi:hypothetical protein
MLRICILIVAILLWPVSLSAADFRNRGAGATSCGTWTHEHREKSIKAQLQDHWVFGFVTAMEFQAPKKNFNSPDNPALIAWVSNYCTKSPLNNLMAAAFGLTLELQNDPADLERMKEIVRSAGQKMCNDGDKEACKRLEEIR